MITRRQFLTGAALAGIFASPAALWEYATRVEPHWLEFTRHRLPVAGLPASLQGATLAHLTDIHVGRDVADSYVLDALARVSAMRPDIVAYTGDFITWYPGFEAQAERIYAAIPTGTRATLAVLGNHDYGLQWSHPEVGDAVANILKPHGVHVLHNEIAEVEGLQVVGFDDLWAGLFDAKAGLMHLDRTKPMLALSHNPDSVDLAGWDGFRGCVLAGHTHGGQVKLPFLPPPDLPLRDRRYAAGAFQLSGGRSMYVNRGVGHINQIRFDVRPEVAIFELTGASA